MNARFPQAQDGLTLRDIHVPPAPSWWPPAPGWWVLSSAVVCLAILTYLLHRRARRKRMARERVLHEIDALATRHADDAAFAAALHQLLRRAARRYAANAHQTQGDSWRQVLASVPVDTATVDALMTLDARMYQPNADFDRASVQAAMHRWLAAALRHTKVTEAGHA